MNYTGKYIYCFIKEKEKVNFGFSVMSNVVSAVYTLPYKEISAVVSDTDLSEIDPTRKNIKAHQQAVTRVMENYDIIPVAFGTVASGRKGIENLIEANYVKLFETIKYLSDKVELGLRVSWSDSGFGEDIEDADIKALKAIVSGREENEVINEKIQLGKLVERATLDKRDEYINRIYTPLSRLSVDSKLKENIPVKTVFNAYFLIRESDSEAFDKSVEKLCLPLEDKLEFSYTGPWPPYNFVDMKLAADELKKDTEV